MEQLQSAKRWTIVVRLDLASGAHVLTFLEHVGASVRQGMVEVAVNQVLIHVGLSKKIFGPVVQYRLILLTHLLRFFLGQSTSFSGVANHSFAPITGSKSYQHLLITIKGRVLLRL